MMAILPTIIIAGGGIIGNSIAYYLAKRDMQVLLVDPVGICPAASAKAGGFLAKDWRDGTPVEQMQRVGFDLHEELAQDLEGIDYRRLTCAAISIDENKAVQKPPSKKLKDVEWVDKGVIGSVPMGEEDTIAQVHPRKLCEAMWKFCESKGSKLVIGRVVRACLNDGGAIEGVELEDGTVLAGDQFVVACGPWTEQARSWFSPKVNLPQITGVKCHSILVKSPDRVLSQAVFFESDGALGEGDLEVYPRPDGDCYINGFPDDENIVSESPGEEKIDPSAIELLKQAMNQTTSLLENLEAHTQQACYWPETPDSLPLIGPIPKVKGAFVATGHGVWGILQGPATGKAVSELILDGESTTLDLGPFSVERFHE